MCELLEEKGCGGKSGFISTLNTTWEGPSYAFQSATEYQHDFGLVIFLFVLYPSVS